MSLTSKRTVFRVVFLAAVIVLASLSKIDAKTTCTPPDPFGVQRCVSEVEFQKFAQEAYKPQYMNQWCWAASISMLFEYYGYSVSQPRIVSEAYGVVANIPANSGVTIAKQVNRVWIDDGKKKFTAKVTGAYDFDAGVKNIDNAWIIRELDNDRPFIVGTISHAMVGTAIAYRRDRFMNVVVDSIGVFDPWPGIGARGLSVLEATPIYLNGALRFIATVSVEEAE